MLRPEHADRSRFPSLALLRASAVDFGLGQEVEVAVGLGAIYAAVLAFADEAEDGVFGSIFAVYAQGDERVNVTLIAERDEASKMVIERVNVGGSRNVYLGGVVASLNVDGSAWNVELAHLSGKVVTVAEFLKTLSDLRALELAAKEVSERFIEID
ncbi:MAG: hypothetical protein A2W73_07880 [Deltaproteobacteria bacterium RIFCSPLOWO2_12_55_13]|nr:MAG: hypothetical protein A2W73_07880 [Deltaproteobacteria bacterium RIFCSPLOWO2_12_55_13]